MRCVSSSRRATTARAACGRDASRARRNVAYHGSFWLKTPDYDGAVTLALGQDQEGGRTYASQVIAKVTADDAWHQYTFTLTPRESDPLAKLTILFDGKGRLWLDQVSLMPGDAVDGVRADVLERIKALKPAFVRWPGGNVAQDYHWQWGIGPRDRRPSWINKAWWNEREPSDFGSDEFIAFCRTIGAEPHVVVNVEGAGATPEEAAAWVEYMNGPPDSKYGAMRAANGHREPFNVKTWELGNEIWGDWVRGYSDAATYARNYLRYRDAMRAVDPSIRFIAVGRDRTDWNDQLLALAGRSIDLLSIHHYDGPSEQQDARMLMAAAAALGDVLPRAGADDPRARAWRGHQADRQRVELGAADAAPAFDGVGALRGPPDERVRAQRRRGRDERGVGPRERLAGRHHPGRPARRLRDADVSRGAAVQRASRRGAARGRRREPDLRRSGRDRQACRGWT